MKKRDVEGKTWEVMSENTNTKNESWVLHELNNPKCPISIKHF